MALIDKEDLESPCVEHRDADHPGQEVSFKTEVKCFPKTTLMRQTMEAHVIEMNMGKSKVINRRGEWGQNLPQS